jgi:hypothetical protein
LHTRESICLPPRRLLVREPKHLTIPFFLVLDFKGRMRQARLHGLPLAQQVRLHLTCRATWYLLTGFIMPARRQQANIPVRGMDSPQPLTIKPLSPTLQTGPLFRVLELTRIILPLLSNWEHLLPSAHIQAPALFVQATIRALQLPLVILFLINGRLILVPVMRILSMAVYTPMRRQPL